jgi:hypothetical protein
MIKRVSFDKPESVVAQPKPTETETEKSSVSTDDRRAIAKAKAKYVYPWWASENPLEVFWGQLHEEIWIIPVEKFLETAKQAMGRQVLKQEFSDRPALADEFLERTPEAVRLELFAKFPAQKAEFADNKYAAN